MQSSWFDTASLNNSGAKPADIQNILLIQDFLNGAIMNTLRPFKLGKIFCHSSLTFALVFSVMLHNYYDISLHINSLYLHFFH